MKTAYSQSIVNDKEYYDSIKPGQLKGQFGAGLNLNNDGAKNVFLLADASVSYATRRHLFEFSNNLYYNQKGDDNASNRFLAYLRLALFRHRFDAKKSISEARFFPEINFVGTYDEGRGLNYRVSSTTGITYSLHNQKSYRIKIGTGIMFERESWRIFEKEFLPSLDTLSTPIKDLIKNLFGIDEKGNIVRDNLRWSSYIQMVVNIGKNVNVVSTGSAQFPFHAPYNGVVNLPEFPANNKKYPRLTVDFTLRFKISKNLAFATSFYLQKDEGQISPFAKDMVMNLSEGLTFTF